MDYIKYFFDAQYYNKAQVIQLQRKRNEVRYKCDQVKQKILFNVVGNDLAFILDQLPFEINLSVKIGSDINEKYLN
jgi:hypothetical protein